MATGDLTMTNHGVFELSSAALKTVVDLVNITPTQFVSGARLHLVPASNGQVRVIEVEVEG